jgi:hypothetical protein
MSLIDAGSGLKKKFFGISCLYTANTDRSELEKRSLFVTSLVLQHESYRVSETEVLESFSAILRNAC